MAMTTKTTTRTEEMVCVGISSSDMDLVATMAGTDDNAAIISMENNDHATNDGGQYNEDDNNEDENSEESTAQQEGAATTTGAERRLRSKLSSATTTAPPGNKKRKATNNYGGRSMESFIDDGNSDDDDDDAEEKGRKLPRLSFDSLPGEEGAEGGQKVLSSAEMTTMAATNRTTANNAIVGGEDSILTPPDCASASSNTTSSGMTPLFMSMDVTMNDDDNEQQQQQQQQQHDSSSTTNTSAAAAAVASFHAAATTTTTALPPEQQRPSSASMLSPMPFQQYQQPHNSPQLQVEDTILAGLQQQQQQQSSSLIPVVEDNSAGGGGSSSNERARSPRSPIINASIAIMQQQQQQNIHLSQQQLQNRAATTTAADHQKSPSSQPHRQQQQRQRQLQHQQHQPPGWRVKLYRLNADGSWDDCGTGRIQFYYARPRLRQQQQQQQQQQLDENIISTTSNNNNNNNNSTTASIFHELGEPMLCMRAEVSSTSHVHQHQQQIQQLHDAKNSDVIQTENSDSSLHNKNNVSPPSLTAANGSSNNNNNSTPSQPGRQKVLLRTRIILSHDTLSSLTTSSAYQCQGGNIITWCEPFNDNNNSNNNVGGGGGGSNSDIMSPKSKYSLQTSSPPTSPSCGSSGGVDLALSFQDNAGCKDIWQHIMNVQARARELLLSSSSSSMASSSVASSPTMKSAGYSSPTRKRQPSPPLHQRSHPPHHTFLHNSPNSPDRDALEDRQLLSLSTGSPPGLKAALYSRVPPLPPTNHATDAVNESYQQHYVRSRTSSSSSSSEDEGEDMMAVSLAAAAAATTTSPRTGRDDDDDDDVSDDDDDDGPQPHIPNNNDLQQRQHHDTSSNTMNYYTNSPTNDNSSNDSETSSSDNININNLQQQRVGRQLLPSNDPTWDDLSSLRDYIANLQLNPRGGKEGVMGNNVKGYQQIMNASLLQREELLIYLASNDCDNLRKLLNLFHDIGDNTANSSSGGEEEADVDNSDDEIVWSNGSVNVNETTNSPSSPNSDVPTKKMKRSNRRRQVEKEDGDENCARLLANIVKSILLLNDPEIIEYVTSDESTFELLCAVLEYDPDLREKAFHVDFLRMHAKFRTVIRIEGDGGECNYDGGTNHGGDNNNCNNNENQNINMNDKSDEYDQYGGRHLIANIHRLFRVNYLRDTILRPTMDESNLSTLVSLGQFMMCDIIRGVLAVKRRQPKKVPTVTTMEEEELDCCTQKSEEEMKYGDNNDSSGDDCGDGENYLVRIIRLLGSELHAIRQITWKEKVSAFQSSTRPSSPRPSHPVDESSSETWMWKQHVAPQDGSLPSRMIRRSGCLMFLNELFSMARMSLQQHEKDEFIDASITMLIPVPMSLSDNEECNTYITEIRESNDDVDGCKQQLTIKNQPLAIKTAGLSQPEAEVHESLLSLISAVLSDPTTNVKERGAALDILGVITMHDPGLIRKYCIEYHTTFVANKHFVVRPTPNNLGEVMFACPTDDLILSLIYVMTTEIDSGLSLQTSEIIRIILDTESTVGEQNEEYEFNDGQNLDNGDGSQAAICAGGGALSNESEQNSFLALFYDRYLHWLIAPFNCLLLVPRFVPPLFSGRENTTDAVAIFGGDNNDSTLSPLLRPIESCPVRASSTLEIISFCVRTHIHRMKFFILRSRLLGVILDTLCQEESQFGVRCLKLASLK